MDVPLLIEEIQKRRPIWDVRHEKHKGRVCVPRLWQEVSENVRCDVEQCKKKWKNLRDTFKAEIRRSERRQVRDKSLGEYVGDNKYHSKWLHFKNMSFMLEDRDTNSNFDPMDQEEEENTNSTSNNNSHYDQNYNQTIYEDNLYNTQEVKLEPAVDLDEDDDIENPLNDNRPEVTDEDEDDDETANDMLFEEFQHIATPQAARRVSASFSLNKAQNPKKLLPKEKPLKVAAKSPKANGRNVKCAKKCCEDQLHFLEDLGREEQSLMKSTRQDITRSNKLDHVGDSDYNFLVSFLPQMKKMNELQNLQFRSRMCDVALNILAPTVTVGENRNAFTIQAIPDCDNISGPPAGEPCPKRARKDI